MSSVTGRIKEIRQPKGGYLPPSLFHVQNLDDHRMLNEEENIYPYITGTAVDYLTRFMMETDVFDAFKISCFGAEYAEKVFSVKGAVKKAKRYLSGIRSIDAQSIINACKLVTYDEWYRNPLNALKSTNADEICPDQNTIQNIQIMVLRSLDFWNLYGPVVEDGFTFEPHGYTDTITSGDGDYLTRDTLWDFKVSRSKPEAKHTLQLLVYWIMGQHSGQKIFDSISKLGIFNPRLNEVYLLDMKEVPEQTIKEVEEKVICY